MDISEGIGLIDNTRPIDGGKLGKWTSAGIEILNSIERSWTVFESNTNELLEVLSRPSKDFSLSMILMGDDREGGVSFWGEVDQRLHNELASAVSLVDHTRRLFAYLGTDVPLIIAEYMERNSKITKMNETQFLRKLRNYLLHYGNAPILQSLSLTTSEHSLKLSASSLLKWSEWNAETREYLLAFGDHDGPLIEEVVVVYANAMLDMFIWLFKQRQAIFNDPDVLNRFRIDRL